MRMSITLDAMENSEGRSAVSGVWEVISAVGGVFRKDVPNTMASEQRSHQKSGPCGSLGQRTGHTKALRWEWTWHVLGAARKPDSSWHEIREELSWGPGGQILWFSQAIVGA